MILPGIILGVMLTAGFAPAGEKQTEKSREAVIVGTELDYPPYSFLDEEGRPSGFNVELTRAIAKVMGLKIEVQIGPWGHIRNSLAAGKIDVISGMYYSKERTKTVDFSPPYTIVHHAIFARRDSPEIKSEADLRGRKIIVMRGDIMHDYALKEGLSKNLGLADTQSEVLRLLSSGKYDFALIAKLPGLYWVKKLGLSNIVTVGPLIGPSAYCYAVEKGNSDLLSRFSEGLAIIKKTDQMKAIYDAWLGVLEPRGVPKVTIFKYVGLSLLVFLLIVAGSVVWVRTLRSQVAQRTKDLEEEISDRKRVEGALRESEKKFSTLFQASPVYIAFTALDDGCFLDVNKAFTKITGYQREETLGRTPVEIGLWVEPEERVKFIELAQRKGAFHEEEVRFRRKNGDILFGIWSAEKIDLAGKTCLVSVLVDVTERRKAQDALRQERDKLRAAISEINTLSGLVPICSNCKKIRDDQGYWNQIEKYIGERSNAQFSHGICPECAKKLYPDFDLYDDEGNLT